MRVCLRASILGIALLMAGVASAQQNEQQANNWQGADVQKRQRVTVDGAVRRPGAYTLKGRTSLLQLVAVSGGLDPMTSDSTVVVFRTADGQLRAARFDINDIRKGRVEDPTILPGDTFVANSSGLVGSPEGVGGRVRCLAAIQCTN
jgi:hypothetical protein